MLLIYAQLSMSKKIHLGCGKRYLEGYLHVDIDEYDHIDYRNKIDNLNMFNDNFAELIYASHCLEYFDRNEVMDVLVEWRRVLEPGGVLRLAVPNFQSLIKIYSETNNLEKILGPLYGKWNVGKDEFIYHKTAYDHDSLKAILEESGFESVKEWDWRIVFQEQEGFDDHSQAYYPHMDKVNGLHVSLNLECVKPKDE